MSEFEDFPMTEDEIELFKQWNALVDSIRERRVGMREMSELCAHMARHRAADARAVRKAYGQPFSRDVARDVVVFDAIEKLLLMLESQAKNLPKGIQMAI